MFIYIMRKILLSIFALATLCYPSSVVFAVSASSNFKVYNGQTGSSAESSNSTNFSVNTGDGPSARSASDNFTAEVGPPVKGIPSAATVESSDSVSGGGGGYTPDDKIPPIFENIEEVEISETQVVILFDTNESAFTYIQYGIDDKYDQQTKPEISFSTSHKFILKSLVPNRKYNYTIHGTDQVGNAVESLSSSFTTLPVIKQVSNPSSFGAVVNRNIVTLSWSNPLANDFQKIVLVRRSDRLPLHVSDGEVLLDATANKYEDTVDYEDSRYYYAIFAIDSSENLSSGAVTSVVISTKKADPAEVKDEKPGEGKLSPPIDIQEKDVSDIKKIIPALPPPLPPEVSIIPKDDPLKDLEIRPNFFTILKQNVSESLVKATETLKNLSKEVKNDISDISSDLFDDFGELRQDIYVTLTEKQRQQIEEIVQEPLPDVFDQESLVTASPLEIIGEEDSDWHVFAQTDASFSIPADVFTKPVQAIILTLKTEAYILDYNDEQEVYEALIKTPSERGLYEALIQIIYEDSTYEEIKKKVLVDPYGYVYEKNLTLYGYQEIKISGAIVSLYTKNKTGEWVLWPANLYNQQNPQATNSEGSFAFVAPNGQYYLQVNSGKHKEFTSDIFVIEDEVVNMNIEVHNLVKKGWLASLIFGIIAITISIVFLSRRKLF
jgi:hypothetical protein